jgi:hypothetical protein
LTSDDTKHDLINLPERSNTPYEPKNHDPSFRRRPSSLVDELDTSVHHHESSSNRTQKGALNRSLTSSESNSEYNKTFRLIIQNGFTQNQTEDFLQFRQLYSSLWDNIVKIFRMLEKLMHHYSVPLALINGER